MKQILVLFYKKISSMTIVFQKVLTNICSGGRIKLFTGSEHFMYESAYPIGQ